jgi:hypothetical protein
MVEHLLNVCESLDSIPSTAKKKKSYYSATSAIESLLLSVRLILICNNHIKPLILRMILFSAISYS